MEKELKDIMKRKPRGPGSLDRLHDYVEDIFCERISSLICSGCFAEEDDACEKCEGFRPMCQLEYDIQTEVILFTEELVAKACS